MGVLGGLLLVLLYLALNLAWIAAVVWIIVKVLQATGVLA